MDCNVIMENLSDCVKLRLKNYLLTNAEVDSSVANSFSALNNETNDGHWKAIFDIVLNRLTKIIKSQSPINHQDLVQNFENLECTFNPQTNTLEISSLKNKCKPNRIVLETTSDMLLDKYTTPESSENVFHDIIDQMNSRPLDPTVIVVKNCNCWKPDSFRHEQSVVDKAKLEKIYSCVNFLLKNSNDLDLMQNFLELFQQEVLDTKNTPIDFADSAQKYFVGNNGVTSESLPLLAHLLFLNMKKSRQESSNTDNKENSGVYTQIDMDTSHDEANLGDSRDFEFI